MTNVERCTHARKCEESEKGRKKNIQKQTSPSGEPKQKLDIHSGVQLQSIDFCGNFRGLSRSLSSSSDSLKGSKHRDESSVSPLNPAR
jgi:hypothetical protein